MWDLKYLVRSWGTWGTGVGVRQTRFCGTHFYTFTAQFAIKSLKMSLYLFSFVKGTCTLYFVVSVLIQFMGFSLWTRGYWFMTIWSTFIELKVKCTNILYSNFCCTLFCVAQPWALHPVLYSTHSWALHTTHSWALHPVWCAHIPKPCNMQFWALAIPTFYGCLRYFASLLQWMGGNGGQMWLPALWQKKTLQIANTLYAPTLNIKVIQLGEDYCEVKYLGQEYIKYKTNKEYSSQEYQTYTV